MTRLVAALVLAATMGAGAIQSPGVLRITVAVAAGDQAAKPVPRYLLLVSDNPSSAPPRRLLTSADGAIEVRLPPGNYTVESDRPVAIDGQAYQWIQMVDVVAGQDTVVLLTSGNAEIGPVTADTERLAAPLADAPVVTSSHWREGAVDVWTPTVRASGAVVHSSGLVVARHPALGTSPVFAVQLSPEVKVAATLLAWNAVRELAVLRIDAAAAALVRPVPMGCGAAMAPEVARQEITAIEVPLGEVCVAVAIAESKLRDTGPPPSTRLPVEPVKPFPPAALKEAAARRTGPHQMSSDGFDLAFITPLHVAGSQGRSQVMDFKNWSDYVAETPPVLLIRATPRLVEGFWAKVGRAAAMTQGIALPAFKRPKSGFSRMRAFCGDDEVAPIHPFKVEQALSDTETIYEGLYVFDPGAFSPSCGTVKLELFSEKEPDKADARIVDAGIITQIWQAFAPYREPGEKRR